MRSVGRDLLFTLIGFLAALFLMGGLGVLLMMQERQRSEVLIEELMDLEKAALQNEQEARRQAEAALQEAEAALQEAEIARKAFEDARKK